MAESRLKNSISNVSSGLVFRIVSLLINFASRTVFIRVLGDGCLGLNGLFTSLLSMFSLAELGIGQAITFYLYKPIAENNEHKLSVLIKFYKACYKIIGIVILVIGICLIPLLPRLVNLETDTGYNVTVIYVLYLINTSVTYLFFSYPQTVLNANQKQYIVNKNESRFVVISVLAEIAALVISHNYVFYLIMKIVIAILKNIVLAVISIRMYPYIAVRTNDKLDKSEIATMFRDVYAIFIVKISSQLFNSTDNLFISTMFGTVLAGYNSNYLMIINAIYGVINTAIYSFGASVGNLYATESKKKTEEVFSVLNFVNCWISCCCTVCLFQLLNPFITIFWGEKYIFPISSVALMCANFYIVSSLYALFNFRQSMGLFRYCIYNQLIAAFINIGLDFVLGKVMGINGLFGATVIANIGIAVFPYARNLYQVGFEQPSKLFVLKIIRGYVTCFAACLTTMLICKIFPITFVGFIGMVIVSLIISNVFNLLSTYKTREFENAIGYVKKLIN